MATKLKLVWGACLLGALLSGCQTTPPGTAGAAGQASSEAAAGTESKEAAKPKDPATLKEEALAQALDIYADGRYDEAITALTPLSTAPELAPASQVKAFKFIAFSHCAQGRLRQCRQNFETALQQDPNFQLSDVEKGHPVWGKEFNAARAAVAARNKRTGKKAP
ncbi:TssQ family T6SS-associated lipoprotein [Acidovorax sp. GBBC 3334]|uniref:TssQ family T6SS-associated lipoprotein n=1 Tax=Acidovorax sp. GBBC 3334 TaxID=2940496 RepID=UPI0023026DBD|nr:TssQ family T6SS-associated lipoprotein [Acidovorax sp. GBBC 3334]MDA8454125.1 TssQ family T6SS-associated lipoprotein [Acidovorax sp. GBBC 3334]